MIYFIVPTLLLMITLLSMIHDIYSLKKRVRFLENAHNESIVPMARSVNLLIEERNNKECEK
jgi:hypothetical protein